MSLDRTQSRHKSSPFLLMRSSRACAIALSKLPGNQRQVL
jgi:hypothetical protein